MFRAWIWTQVPLLWFRAGKNSRWHFDASRALPGERCSFNNPSTDGFEVTNEVRPYFSQLRVRILDVANIRSFAQFQSEVFSRVFCGQFSPPFLLLVERAYLS